MAKKPDAQGKKQTSKTNPSALPGGRTDKTKSPQRFGAHMSVAGGLHNAYTAGVAVGCDCLQIFVKNQRQWRASPLTEEQIKAFKVAQSETALTPTVAHASYLLNLASPDAAARQKSCDALVDELERCEALGVSGLVVHPGAHMGEGIDAGIERISQSLDVVHGRTAGFRAQVLLECVAGQGSTIGFEMAQLGRMMSGTKAPERLGVCLDTCHLFAAGYDLRDEADYARMVDELAQAVGLDNVKCIHVNDSKGECGSRIDRHDHIGQGKIGVVGFTRLLNDSRLAGVPKILETPKGLNEHGVDLDTMNLRCLRGMIL